MFKKSIAPRIRRNSNVRSARCSKHSQPKTTVHQNQPTSLEHGSKSAWTAAIDTTGDESETTGYDRDYEHGPYE